MRRLMYGDLYTRYRKNAVDLHKFLRETGMTWIQATEDDLLHMLPICARKILEFIVGTNV